MTARISTWLAEPLPADVAIALARLAAAPDVAHIAVMPDVHLAHDVCIGTVLATHATLLPAAVGGDIGCGVTTIRLRGDAAWLADRRAAAQVLTGVAAAVPTRRHARRRPLPAALDGPLSHPALETVRRRDGGIELGTLGRGNHFLEVQTDEAGSAWLMVHTGSRALGQAIRDHHVRQAAPVGGGLAGLDADSGAGRAYLADVAWARAYAAANRRAIAHAAGEVLATTVGAALEPATLVDCDHNHVRAQDHDDGRLWVHRKGAISAEPGEAGLIPGSMGTATYHVEGRGVDAALRSASHGAGRRLGRGAARQALGARQVLRQLEGVWFDHRLLDELRDEAPGAYKDIQAVMRAQRDLVKITRALRPRLVYKGGR